MQPLKTGLLLSAAAAFCVGTPAISQAQTASSPISQLAIYTAQSVSKQVSGELTSWGMAQLGFQGSDGTAELESLLKEVVAELAAIEQDVADLDCIANATEAQDAAARIQGAWNTYQLAVEASYIDPTTLTNWTNYVRGVGGNSLTADLQLISNDFTGQGSGQSILASCETAADVQPPKTDTLDDRPAWTFSTNLIEYYADTEIVGVAMLADDFHLQAYQAWLAEGNTADSTTTDNLPVAVCGDLTGASSARAGACAAAADDYTTYRGNVVAILDYGGAPYSTDQQLLLNGRGSLWVVNYNDFMTAGGYASTCVKETSAGTPCGAGVGKATLDYFYKLDSTSDEVSYGSYVTTWSPAYQSDWTHLLKNWKTDHLVDYLSALPPSGLGFDRSSLENRFFYNTDIVSGDYKISKAYGNGNAIFHNLELACFVSPESPYSHGGFKIVQPLCDLQTLSVMGQISFNHKKKNNTCITYQVHQNLINDTDPETQVDALISNFVGGRYQMSTSCDDGEHVRGWEDPISNRPPGHPPGWMLKYRANITDTDTEYDTGDVPSPVNPQYRWPVLNLADYYTNHYPDCAAESTNRNGTGVLPSLCGPLLDAYVNAYIPPAPAGAVPTLTVPDHTLVVLVDQYEVPDGTYLQVRQLVNYGVSAVDPDRGVLTPDCFPSSGTELGLGITRVQCSATDQDGDSVKRDFNVHVEYPFRFVNTLADPGGMVWLRAGRRIEIQFRMGGYKGLDVMTAAPTSTRINCNTGKVKGKPKEIGPNRHGWWRNQDPQLSYNETQGKYSEPWKTRRNWRNQCRRLTVSLVDDTARTVDVHLY